MPMTKGLRYGAPVMGFRALTCPACGAPLPTNAKRATIVCVYCHATVAWEQNLVHAAAYREALARAGHEANQEHLLHVSGAPYRLLSHFARGESGEVFWAESARRMSERVLLKVLRAEQDSDLWNREGVALSRLAQSDVVGAEHFSTLVPRVVADGPVASGGSSEKRVRVMRWSSGFVHTLADVRRVYPQGIDPRHSVWLWRRLLEVLDFIHRTGLVHGAVLPQHVVIHARDHGVMLVGFGCAGSPDQGLPAISVHHEHLYPEMAHRGELDKVADLIMSARCILLALDAQLRSTPAPLANLLHEVAFATRSQRDAQALAQQVGEVAKSSFGPSRFVPFAMPGWR